MKKPEEPKMFKPTSTTKEKDAPKRTPELINKGIEHQKKQAEKSEHAGEAKGKKVRFADLKPEVQDKALHNYREKNPTLYGEEQTRFSLKENVAEIFNEDGTL